MMRTLQRSQAAQRSRADAVEVITSPPYPNWIDYRSTLLVRSIDPKDQITESLTLSSRHPIYCLNSLKRETCSLSDPTIILSIVVFSDPGYSHATVGNHSSPSTFTFLNFNSKSLPRGPPDSSLRAAREQVAVLFFKHQPNVYAGFMKVTNTANDESLRETKLSRVKAGKLVKGKKYSELSIGVEPNPHHDANSRGLLKPQKH